MGFLREESKWVDTIYGIERHDPLMGGEYGIVNLPPKQLASRTLYLFERLFRQHDENGAHKITNEDIVDSAAISESKLLLDVATATIYDGAERGLAELTRLVNDANSLTDLERSLFGPLYKALLLSWKYGYPRFAFDLFNRAFTMRDTFLELPLIETIRGDDSIDVLETENVVPGETYILWDKEEERSRFVVVKAVLSRHRVILYTDEEITRGGTGVLTKMNWEPGEKRMKAKAGRMYVSAKQPLLQNIWGGSLLIAHLDPAQFKVEIHRAECPDPTFWEELPLISCEFSRGLGLWRSVYKTPGQELYFRITALDDAEVEHLVLMSDSFDALSSTIRTPVVADGDFTLVRFGAIYGAKHTGTHFEFSKSRDFSKNTWFMSFGVDRDPRPVWDYKNRVLSLLEIKPGEDVYWRAWYTADDGGKSSPSNIGHYTHVVEE